MRKTKTPRTGRPPGVKETKPRRSRQRVMTPPGQRFGSTREAADRVGLGEKTIRMHLAHYAHRVGGRIVVDFEALDAWLISRPPPETASERAAA